MRLRCLAIAALALAAMAVVCNAQQADYAGSAKLVLKLVEMPKMPDNPAKTGGPTPTAFGFPVIVGSGSTGAFDAPEAPKAPAVPQGTLFQATVLYSDDPAIQVNGSYTLALDYDPQAMPDGLKDDLLDRMVPGAIVGVDAYTQDGNTIKVEAGTAYWQRRIFILEARGEKTKNPFRMDLSFKQFPDFDPFPRPGSSPPTISVPAPVVFNSSWRSALLGAFGGFFS